MENNIKEKLITLGISKTQNYNVDLDMKQYPINPMNYEGARFETIAQAHFKTIQHKDKDEEFKCTTCCESGIGILEDVLYICSCEFGDLLFH